MLIRQTILYLPAQIVAPLIQFASVLIWSHLLAPEHLGTVTMMVAIQEISYLTFFGWWSLSMLRFITGYTGPEERGAYLRSESGALALSLLLQTLILLPVLNWYFGQTLNGASLALALAFMLTRSFNDYMADRARAEAKIALYTFVQTVGPVAGFLVGLFWIWRVGPSSEAVLAGYVIAQIIGISAGILRTDFCRSIGRISGKIVREAFAFGATQSVSRLLAVVAINVPRFIIASTLGLAAVGLFNVGYSLGIRASSFAVTLVTAGAYPLVVKKMNQEGAEAAFRQLSQNMVLVALVVAPVAFGLFGINRSLVGLLVDPAYQAITLAVLPLATFGGLFRYLRAHTSDQVFLLSLKPVYGTVIAVVDLCVAVLAAWIGVLLLDVKGAALGPMIAGLATFTLSFALSRYRFGFRAPLGAFLRIAIAAAIMGGAVHMLPVATAPWMLAGQIAVGGVLFVGLTLLLMADERQVLLAQIRAKLSGRGRKQI